MLSSNTNHDPSRLQGSLWSQKARDWFEIQEAQSKALYTIVLKALNPAPDTALLDAGCGAGMFCEMAAEKGVNATGLDVSSGMIGLARQRAPRAVFFEAEMEAVPFVDASFDAVTMLNSLHHAGDPQRVLAEARRVLRPGGRLAVAAWARPEACQISAYFHALDDLLPVSSPHTPAAFAYSTDGALRKLLARAGFAKQIETQAIAIWTYRNEEEALRGLLSLGTAVQAAGCAGEERVRDAARTCLAPFRLATGGFRLENAFHYVIAQRL